MPFVVEMTVENGRGYRTAAEGTPRTRRSASSRSTPSSARSSASSTSVEDTRVGQRTNYDKLILEIWTNGTVGPEMALVEAAKILRKHLNPFIQYAEPGPGLPADGRRPGRLPRRARSTPSSNASST